MMKSKMPGPEWSDEQLVKACLGGDGEAWNVLVDRYKRLIYSIILKYGADPEDASDLFQAVWLDAYNDLDKLRKRTAVKPWLISLTSNKCYHWKQKKRKQWQHEVEVEEYDQLDEGMAEEPAFVEELAQQQIVRDAIAKLSERCQTMIRLLFFTFPPKPYNELAEELGLATGSIGFIRGRCLKSLQKELEALDAKAAKEDFGKGP